MLSKEVYVSTISASLTSYLNPHITEFPNMCTRQTLLEKPCKKSSLSCLIHRHNNPTEIQTNTQNSIVDPRIFLHRSSGTHIHTRLQCHCFAVDSIQSHYDQWQWCYIAVFAIIPYNFPVIFALLLASQFRSHLLLMSCALCTNACECRWCMPTALNFNSRIKLKRINSIAPHIRKSHGFTGNDCEREEVGEEDGEEEAEVVNWIIRQCNWKQTFYVEMRKIEFRKMLICSMWRIHAHTEHLSCDLVSQLTIWHETAQVSTQHSKKDEHRPQQKNNI